MLIFEKLRIGYQDLPKTASTSLFFWFHELLYGSSFNDVNKGNVRSKYPHDFFMTGESEYVTVVKNEHKLLDGNTFNFALTRDPVRRFLSMYSNRIVHYRELSGQGMVGKKLAKQDLLPDPQINELVSRLDEYFAVQPRIFHHTRPQLDLLGSDLSVYTRLADISEVGDVIDEIKEFWRENGLAFYSDRAKPLGREQTGGPKLGLEILAPESFERLLDYYKCDYEAIPTLSIEKIKKEYRVCREENPAPDAVEFYKLGHGIVIQPDKAGVSAHPAIEAFWWNLQGKKKVDVGQALKGAVVIKDGFERSDFELSVIADSKKVPCNWGLASPAMEKKYINNTNAKRARFSAPEVFKSAGKKVSLVLTDGVNNSVEIASVRLKG